MFERSPDPNDVVNLLSRLKANTPDYPSDLMTARKAAFLGQIATTNFGSPGQGGKGGGDGGSLFNGSSVFGGMSTAQGIILQAVIGVWIIAAMLTAAYVFRNQIIDLLQDYGIVTVEITQLPSIDSPVPVTGLPSSEIPPTELTALSATAVPGVDVTSEAETTSDNSSDGQGTSVNPDDSQDDPGLHLGQTPGTPDPPNKDKPDKPDKKNNK